MKSLMKEVDMIAYFKISDLPYPIRFRIKEDKTESLKTISVDDIIQKVKIENMAILCIFTIAVQNLNMAL